MAKKGFLYTGIAFLVMASVLISINYMFLSKHAKEQSKIVDAEIDLMQAMTMDAKGVLALNQNNTVADAMSDDAFRALNIGGTMGQICTRLDPAHPSSETDNTNISKWILNYTNMAFSRMTNITGMNFSSFTLVPNSSRLLGGNTLCTITYQANISYLISNSYGPYFQLNQTLALNKTLQVNQTSSGPPEIYKITVKDQGRLNFNKSVSCTGTWPSTRLCALLP